MTQGDAKEHGQEILDVKYDNTKYRQKRMRKNVEEINVERKEHKH